MARGLHIPALRSLTSASNTTLGPMLSFLSVPGSASQTTNGRIHLPVTKPNLPRARLMLEDYHLSLSSLCAVRRGASDICRLAIICCFADVNLDRE
ncbi:hypothetical protein ARMSODRAFT_192742 [Armillaria solidipes]|uniref:Uncharacterized protein n=1 Tax=Armillaria solidipes TaxID=1076256 RepID=A0A2H3BRW9_9AGAR|nr:hypothetical protein ARMSODRAFT_192742 [Armillaria solidipes]